MSDATTVWGHIVTWIEDTIEHQQKDRQYMKDHDGLPAPGNTDYWGPNY
jgi:hypothetical protein